MKKEKLVRIIIFVTLIALMVCAIVVLALQLNSKKLSKVEVSRTSQNSDAIQVESEGRAVSIKSEETDLTIDDVDWKTLNDVELNDVINATGEQELAMFIYSLDEEETELLLSKNTSLLGTVKTGVETGETYTDENGEEWPEIEFKVSHDRYYDYLKEEYATKVYEISTMGNWNTDDSTDTTTTSSGKFTLKITKNSNADQASTIITFEVLNVTKGTYTVDKSKYTIVISPNSAGIINEDNWETKAIKIEHHLEGQNDDDETWDGMVVEGTFNKPDHYFAKWSVVQSPVGYGRMSTHANNFNYDTLDHEGAASNGVATHSWDWNTNKDKKLNITAVRIQCHGNNCGLNAKTANNPNVRSSITGVIELHKYKETVKLNLDGGTISGSTTFTGLDQDILTLNTPTKAGYVFTGWKVNSRTGGANGQLISSNKYQYCIKATFNPSADAVNEYGYTEYFGAFENTTGTTELIAQWTPSVYYIKYDGNGETGGSTATSTHYMDQAKNLTKNGYTRTGYIFKGWTSNKDGTGTSYTDEQSVVNVYNDLGLEFKSGMTITLYAKWEPIVYYVNYIGNGATGGSTARSTHVYDKKSNLTKNGYVKHGYVFTGWDTKSDGTGVDFTDEQEILNLPTQLGLPLKNGMEIDLYAQWRPIIYYVDYDGNGATGGSTPRSTHQYDIPSKLNKNGYTKTLYVFTGWNSIADGTGMDFSDEQPILNLPDVLGLEPVDGMVITIYAQWVPQFRVVSGTVWEDQDVDGTDNERLGNGIKEDTEKGVKNVKAELFEVKDDGTIAPAQIHYSGPDGSEQIMDAEAAYTDDNGYYQFGTSVNGGIMDGNYIVKYTYGTTSDDSGGNITSEINGNTINARNYKSTIITDEKIKEAIESSTPILDWHKTKQDLTSIAVDNLNDRLGIENLNYGNFEDNDKSISAYTKTFEVAKATDKASAMDWTTFDFGIIERPREDFLVDKIISNLKITLANGQILLYGNPYEIQMDYVKALGTKSDDISSTAEAMAAQRKLVYIEMDNEIIQGSELNIQYKIRVTNYSEIDYDYSPTDGSNSYTMSDQISNITNETTTKYYYFGDKTDGTIIKDAIPILVDYLDPEVTFDSSTSSTYTWTIKTPQELKDGYSGHPQKLLSDNSYTNIKDYTMLITDKFAEIERVGDDANNGLGANKKEVLIGIKKLLSTKGKDHTYDNNIEILEINGKVARTISEVKEDTREQVDKTYKPGNYKSTNAIFTYVREEQDDDVILLTITPPTGIISHKKTYLITILIGLIIILIEIIVIKRRILP